MSSFTGFQHKNLLAALCTSALGVHGEWQSRAQSPGCHLLSLHLAKHLDQSAAVSTKPASSGHSLTENHGTDVHPPRKCLQERGQHNLHPSCSPPATRQALPGQPPSQLQFSSASSHFSVILAGKSGPRKMGSWKSLSRRTAEDSNQGLCKMEGYFPWVLVCWQVSSFPT